MRNDARPIGESAGHDRSPIRDHVESGDRASWNDRRDEATRGRPSPIVNRSDEEEPPRDRERGHENSDPVMPSPDPTLRTKI